MKTTVDLQHELIHVVEIRALHQSKKLKNLIAEFLGKEIAANSPHRPKLRQDPRFKALIAGPEPATVYK